MKKVLVFNALLLSLTTSILQAQSNRSGNNCLESFQFCMVSAYEAYTYDGANEGQYVALTMGCLSNYAGCL